MSVKTSALTTTSQLDQPMLLESNEFRRKVDTERDDTITKLSRVETDIATLKTQLTALETRREDLLLIISAADKVLVTIPAPAAGTQESDAE